MALIRSFADKKPRIADDVFLAETAVIIGDVVIEAGVSIWYGAVLRGDVGPIVIGAGSNVQDLSCVHTTGGLSEAIVGENVTIGHSVTLHGGRVEDGALIGMGSTILDNAVIGAGCLVAAGTVITPRTHIPAGHLVRGVPGKVVRELSPEERATGSDGAADYRRLAERYRSEGYRA